MISDNVDLLNDMNTLMKGVRKREEIHLSLIDYIKKMINNKDDCIMFVEEELRMHKLFQIDIISKDAKVRQEEEILKEKYSTKIKLQETEVKFIGRLSTRILEICQASFQKLKQYFNFYEEPHTEFHQSFGKMVQNEQLDLTQIITIVLGYSRTKYDNDINTYQLMIDMIERGDKDLIWKVTQDRQDKRTAVIQTKKVEQQRRRSVMIMQTELQHRREKERLSKLKEQAKTIENNKKTKTKFVDKVYVKLYGILDFERKQLMDDRMFVCKPDQQYKKLYTQMFDRNHLVNNQIITFYSKADDFKQKIRKFKESIIISPISRPKPRMDCSLDIPLVSSSMVSLLNNKEQKTKEVVSQRLIQMQSSPVQKRKSVQSNLERRMEHKLELHRRFPQIIPVTDRRQKRERYEFNNKVRRLSETRNQQTDTSMKQYSKPQIKQQMRMMQVPLIQLNIADKFQFKIHQPHKKQVISKAFEYTFHLRKRENRFQETRFKFLQ